MNFLFFHTYSIFTELFILINVCLLLIFGVTQSIKNYLGYPILSKIVALLTIQILFFSLILEISKSPIFLTYWNNLFNSDSFSLYSKQIIIIIYITIILSKLQYNFFEKLNKFEYWILILLSVISTFLLIQSYDFLSIYISLEFQSLIFYILASFNRSSEFSIEAGLKYFILGAFSSAFLLFGTSMLYNLTGLTNFLDLQLFFLDLQWLDAGLKNSIIICLICILVSFLFKFNAAPFHFWTPDVYEGSPSSITMFFSIIPKIPILGILYKIIILIFFNFLYSFYFLFCFSVILSSIIGTFGAFFQIKWKRFLVYSSISQVSFLLIGCISSCYNSVSVSFFYLLIYIIILISFFSFFLDFRILKFPNKLQSRYLNSLKSLNYVNPLISFSFIIILFSIIGIPPLAGFFSKFFVLFSSIKNNIFGLVFLIVFFNCISCFYYLRLIKFIYFDNITNYYQVIIPISKMNSLILGISIWVLLFTFLDLEFFLLLSKLLAFSFLY